MTEKYYLDTSIWRDYYENRSDRFRPLGEWAFQLLSNSIKNNDIIIYSDLVLKELQRKYTLEEITTLLGIFNKKGSLIKAIISESQVKEAAVLCKQREVAFGDALHAILARDNHAVMVTRDKHFLQLSDLAKIRKPEELL